MKQSTRAHGEQQLVSFRAFFLSFSVMLRCSHLDRIESLPIISTKLFHFHFDWIILTFLAIIFELFAIIAAILRVLYDLYDNFNWSHPRLQAGHQLHVPLVSQFVFISAVPVLVGLGKAVIETFILWKLSFMNQLLLYCYHFVIISFGGIFIHSISEIVSAELWRHNAKRRERNCSETCCFNNPETSLEVRNIETY